MKKMDELDSQLQVIFRRQVKIAACGGLIGSCLVRFLGYGSGHHVEPMEGGESQGGQRYERNLIDTKG